MKRHSFGKMNCSLAQSLELIGEWWTLLIIREAMWGTSRFDDFHMRLGIARNVLTARLVKLEEAGILLRQVSPDNARIFDYTLTSQGWDLFTTVVALMQWGDRWIYQRRGAPIEFFDAKSGLPIQQLAIRNSAGHMLEADSIEIRAGPGADKATIKRASGKPSNRIDK
jgi:DNA-binding HxlR family transcriptional regulator